MAQATAVSRPNALVTLLDRYVAETLSDAATPDAEAPLAAASGACATKNAPVSSSVNHSPTRPWRRPGRLV